MSQPCYLLFALHNHQPVGNFESVFEEAHLHAYQPFVEALERHPRIKVTLHFSGPLLDYLLAHHADYIGRLRALAESGRIELLTSGYYEPILASIPMTDRLGQIRKMNEAVESHFGRRPEGLWLAERVWEPRLAETLARAGVRWCPVDDLLFRSVGASEADCLGYWLTEELGQTIAVVPILEKLRYTIPFAEVEDSFNYLRQFTREADRPLLAFVGDDGEKFGVWPGTHKHCYQDGWLERFFRRWEELIEEFPPLLPNEALSRLRPRGRIYLPAGSYPELMAWSLPASSGRAFEAGGKSLEKASLREELKPFFRGGLWFNFLAKYPESNHIHKKMLLVSERINAALAADPNDILMNSARDFLWQGQCNCAYWHGLFGGLYLVHLRFALQRTINIANRLWAERKHGAGPWLCVEERDLDGDGSPERIIETDRWMIVCAPANGGALTDVTWKGRDLNLCDTLARREEAYHPEVSQAVVEEITDEAHDHSTKDPWGHLLAKQPDLARYLRYDAYRRVFAIDHFFPLETKLELFRDREALELGDFIDQPYTAHANTEENGIRLTLERQGAVADETGHQSVSISKTLMLRAGEDAFTLHYRLSNLSDRPLAVLWGVELNINLLAGDAPDRYPFVEGAEVRDRRLIGDEEHSEARVFGMIDEWMNLKVSLTLSEPARVWRYGLESVSLSERGLEGNYQGTCLTPVWRLELQPGAAREVTLAVACGAMR